MMMAGGAGLAAGALVGAGSYYVYSRLNKKNYPGNYKDRSWCRPNSQPHRTMLCYDCQQMTGKMSDCEVLDDCYRSDSKGCSYELPGDTIRDDVMTAGFVPDEYKSPFTITIMNITGEDYKVTEICPTDQPEETGAVSNSWKRASQIEQSLFMTLTEMTALDVTAKQSASSAHHANIGVVPLLLLFILSRFFGRRA